MAAITVAMRTEISQLYVSLFGRAPDSEGLGFWVSSYAGGNTIAKIAQAMYETAPARAYYPLYATPSEVVTTFYSNVLGRAPDAEGLAFWVKEFNAAATPGTFFAKLVSNVVNYNGTDAAGLTSQSLFNNKVAVAQFYAENGGAVAGATAALSGVTSVASTVDTAKAAILNPAPAVVAAQTFTLTTSVDEVVGGAGADTIKGILGTSGTYGVGDNIGGGSGSDTLNLVTNGSGIAGGMVSIDSVETINVRLLSSAGEAVTMNATDWSGVETITNASSLSSTVLTVTGMALTTDVKLYGETTINAGFSNTTTASAAVNVILSDGSAATVNVDANAAGLISSVAVDLQGTTNLANIEAGANVTKYTVTGSARGYLNTNDTITSFDASAATGAVDMTFSGQSDVVAVGGSGNDTFRFGTNYNNSDSMNGGSGTDTIALTVGVFGRNLNTTLVENATVTFSEAAGGILNASASTVTAYTLAAGTANAASLSSLADGSVFTLNDSDINGLTLDYASGALTTTLNLGSSAVIDIGALTITDVASVTIQAVGSGVQAVSGAVSMDADVKTLIVGTSGGEADLVVAGSAQIALVGATTVTITSAGSGSIDFGSSVSAAATLTTLTVNAGGTDAADVEIGTIQASGITSINLNANGGADVVVGNSVIGAGGSATTKDLSLTVNVLGVSSDVTVGTMLISGQGTLTIDLNQSATGNVHVGAITLAKTGTADAAAQNITLDSTNVISGATAGLASITLSAAGTGAQVNIGAVTVGVDGQFSAGAIDASTATNVDLSDITITLAASSESSIGVVSTTAGAVGNIDVVVGAYASAGFGNIAASAMGSIEIDSANGRGYVDFGNLVITKNLGTVEVTGAVDNSDVTIGNINASGVGAISVAGAGNFTVGKITATNVGTVTSTQGVSGQFTIDLTGVTNAVEVVLGRASNTVKSGIGNDVITLTSGSTGNDSIVYSTATQGNDLIVNFGAGSSATAGGADLIVINASALPLSVGSGSLVTTATDVSLLMFTGASATMGSATNIVLMTTAFASTAAMVTQLAQLSWSTAQASGTDSVLVVWGNGDDTYVSVASITAGAASTTSWASASAAITLTDTTLLTLDGVSAGQLVAANFDFI